MLAVSELRKKKGSQISELSGADFCFFSKEKPLLAVSSSSSITKIAVASWFDGISEGKPIGHGAHRNFNRRPANVFLPELAKTDERDFKVSAAPRSFGGNLRAR